MFKEVRHGGLLLAVIGNITDVAHGKSFYGNGESPLEWGIFNLDADVTLQPHIHKVRERIHAHKTIEFLYVIQGSIGADFYNFNKEIVQSATLGTGDLVCLYDGGHGFRILEDDTKFIEVKSGPFVGVEEDKEKF